MTETTQARTPIRFANYGRDVTHMVGEVKGPNMLGEFMVAVSADYDAETNTTRTGFAFATTHDMAREMETLSR